jgi:hypothetical protein
LSDFINRIFFSQTWTDVSKNSSKTGKNTEKWFSRNISGEMWSQAICVWDTLIQVNQSNSASVWWTVHVRNRFETAYTHFKKEIILLISAFQLKCLVLRDFHFEKFSWMMM